MQTITAFKVEKVDTGIDIRVGQIPVLKEGYGNAFYTDHNGRFEFITIQNEVEGSPFPVLIAESAQQKKNWESANIFVRPIFIRSNETTTGEQ